MADKNLYGLERELEKLALKYKALAQVTPAAEKGGSPLVHPLITVGKIAGKCNSDYGGGSRIYFAGGEVGGIGDPTHYIGIGKKRRVIERHSIEDVFAHFGFNAGLPRAVEVLTAFRKEYLSRVPNGHFPLEITPELMPTGVLGCSGSLSFSITGKLSVVVEYAYEAIKSTTVPVYASWAPYLR